MSALKKLKEWFYEYILSLFIVPKCVSCFSVIESDKDALCPECKHIYELESKLECSVCRRPHTHCTCRVRFEELSIPLFHVTGYDIKRNAISKNIVLHIKDNNYPAAFDFMAAEMAEVLKLRLPLITSFPLSEIALTWVPRSAKAKRRAGHDQSYEMAKRIAVLLDCRLVPMFENSSSSFQKTLGKAKRRDNAKKSYALIDGALDGIGNRHVVLIDDIVTTGASIGACAQLLRSAGVKHVSALVYAKTESRKGVMENDVF